ncbi:GNAT family N-acetyltransferase [Flavilitoribacter nigricans]|uniref:GNAT family N-acetyltransferase n=1 Tax=Flavilitoribacter nigricans (strain ATCC 23147 / DSM 23189 / NBRC 102662 / NCIMB 1420 / SS-2) TaxID=1122177 RepID=A0A2D0NAK9_FLAN2|nr:GNAT family N-acetyltransferase [Flavilitoribacter nigricans]PHN04813.1 GNAT family N-acetyltransferase [Flavilitoribacter nigricans DSM 23189 = NBRC 102662]
MQSESEFIVRNATPDEYRDVGVLMVEVYAQLAGFPSPTEQPAYYQMLRDVGTLTDRPDTELLVAAGPGNAIWGAVVYFGDMQYYGSGGTATREPNAAGFRLLAVSPAARGRGIGRRLTQACIAKARQAQRHQLIIHTTKAMMIAWGMYEKMGFQRSEDLDFMQGDLPVFGFRLMLNQKTGAD